MTDQTHDKRLLELRALALGQRIDGSDAEQLRQEVAGVIDELISLRRVIAESREALDHVNRDSMLNEGGMVSYQALSKVSAALRKLAEAGKAASQIQPLNQRHEGE